MAKWVPILFDILTVVLFIGGCLLLWLNLRPRGRDVLLTPKEIADPWSEEETANPALEARHLKTSASEEPLEAIVDYTAHATPSEDSVRADRGDMADLNSYAGRIAVAMKKPPNQRLPLPICDSEAERRPFRVRR
jgi:hypothetical protein